MHHHSPIVWPSAVVVAAADFVDRQKAAFAPSAAEMSQDEDPYAVSSDSEDEKGPPPKIAIERETDISQIKESLAQDEHKPVKDERTLEEIEELRKTKAAAVKRDFEEGKVSTAEGAQKAKEEVHGLDRSTLGQFKDKFENMSDTLQQNMAEKMQAGATKDELEEIKSQVNEVKQKWRTGDLEGADIQEDSATRDELEALKGVNVKERFQPGQGEFQKSYNRSELDTSGAADARKSFLEGSAFVGREVASAAAGELSELKFGALNAYKDKFEKGLNDAEDIERAKVELDLQLKELRKTFEKPESEMSPEERAEKKKAEIEAEFARYKLARKLRVKQQQESGGAGDEAAAAQDAAETEEGEYDVKNLMNKFLNIDLTPKERASKLDELEALRVEAKNLTKKFEQANLDSVEVSEDKRRQLEAEFEQLKEDRHRARQEYEQEMATAAAQGGEKEEIQVAADHASKMAAKWEKIHAKEAKKAEKSKMPAAKGTS
ncbi:hypothetical protein niasHT_021854 [Heterodera trifolii]|uniref:Uncharacterized protein n=1 Tax=Heterodera trifolii TaxID=157864 RepID=A0ABD2JCC9_9BILA